MSSIYDRWTTQELEDAVRVADEYHINKFFDSDFMWLKEQTLKDIAAMKAEIKRRSNG